MTSVRQARNPGPISRNSSEGTPARNTNAGKRAVAVRRGEAHPARDPHGRGPESRRPPPGAAGCALDRRADRRAGRVREDDHSRRAGATGPRPDLRLGRDRRRRQRPERIRAVHRRRARAKRRGRRRTAPTRRSPRRLPCRADRASRPGAEGRGALCPGARQPAPDDRHEEPEGGRGGREQPAPAVAAAGGEQNPAAVRADETASRGPADRARDRRSPPLRRRGAAVARGRRCRRDGRRGGRAEHPSGRLARRSLPRGPRKLGRRSWARIVRRLRPLRQRLLRCRAPLEARRGRPEAPYPGVGARGDIRSALRRGPRNAGLDPQAGANRAVKPVRDRPRDGSAARVPAPDDVS